jgi:hypothetical protein
MPCKVLYECEALLRFLTRNILVGVFFLENMTGLASGFCVG